MTIEDWGKAAHTAPGHFQPIPGTKVMLTFRLSDGIVKGARNADTFVTAVRKSRMKRRSFTSPLVK